MLTTDARRDLSAWFGNALGFVRCFDDAFGFGFLDRFFKQCDDTQSRFCNGNDFSPIKCSMWSHFVGLGDCDRNFDSYRECDRDVA